MGRNPMKNLLISFTVFVNVVYSQFYYYSGDIRGSRAEGIVENVYRVNLRTGEKEIILTGVGTPEILPEINKIVFKSIPQLEICIYDAKKGIIDTLSYLGKYEKVYQIHTVPPDSNIFLGLVKLDARIIDRELLTLETTELLIDKDSYSILDTTCWYYFGCGSVISREGKRIYTLIDSIKGIYFQTEDTETGKIIEEFAIEGYENLPLKYPPYVIGSANGYIFVGYLSKEDNNGYLILCDPENKKAISQLVMPVGEPPYEECLTPKGDMVFQDGGNIYIFDRQTAQLKQRFKFQISENANTKSRIFMVGDSLYFFPEDPEKSNLSRFDNIGHGDLSKEQSNLSLIEMLLEDVEEAYQKGWIANKGIYNSLYRKLENAKKHLIQEKTHQAGNLLKAFVNEVEAQKGKHLTKEAYSLLKFNGECLIKRLER